MLTVDMFLPEENTSSFSHVSAVYRLLSLCGLGLLFNRQYKSLRAKKPRNLERFINDIWSPS